MRMVSIGFIPLKWSDNESEKLEGQSGVTYSEIEPIELSLVNIGSNRYALSDLPMKIRNDSVMKSTYEQLVEGNTAIGVSEKEVAEPTQEIIIMATEDKDQLESKPAIVVGETQESDADKEKQSKADEVLQVLYSLSDGDINKVGKVLDALNVNDTIVETTTTTNTNSLLTEDDIEVAKADTEAKLMEAKARTAKAEAEIAESKAKMRNLRLEVKGDSLSDYLNEQIGDGDDRTDFDCTGIG